MTSTCNVCIMYIMWMCLFWLLFCLQSSESYVGSKRPAPTPLAGTSSRRCLQRGNTACRGSMHFFQRHLLRPSILSSSLKQSKAALRSTVSEFHREAPEQYVAFQLSTQEFVPLIKEGDKMDEIRAMLDIENDLGLNVVDTISMAELRSKWLDICIDENCPDDFENIRYDVLIPQLVKPGRHLRITDKFDFMPDKFSSVPVTFLTEFELHRLWRRQNLQSLISAPEEFNAKDALLLINDEIDEQLLGGAEVEGVLSSPLARNASSDVSEPLLEDEDSEEILVTEVDLQRLWNHRSPIKFGLPAAVFNPKDALLLINDDKESYPASEYLNYYQASLQYKEYNPAEDCPQFAEKKYHKVCKVLKSIYDDLEDFQVVDKGWQKESNMLSPDVETQELAGDVMFSNTYITTKLPANRHPDPMIKNPAYAAMDSMAMPGEPETNYNLKDPLWELVPHLDLPPPRPIPVMPPLTEHDFLLRTADDYDPNAPPVEEVKVEEKPEPKKGVTEIDWETFDFSSAMPTSPEDMPTSPEDSVDDFFNSFNEVPIPPKQVETQKDPEEEEYDRICEEYHQKPDIIKVDLDANYEKSNRDIQRNLIINKKWKTPKSWLSNPEFRDHVPYEIWSQYDSKYFQGHDDDVWDSDIYTALAVQRIANLTDYYLRNHVQICDKIRTEESEQRYLNALLTAGNATAVTYPVNQSIPSFLVPDKHRGVVYSDEIMELKSKIVMAPQVPSPKEAWGDEEFGYNEELRPVNMVGTMREQYDWTPDLSLQPYVIEEEKLAYIQPILDFSGRVGILKSTKDNVLVFDYRGGIMRHIIGIRDAMMMVARQQCPEIKDIRLESELMFDATDV